MKESLAWVCVGWEVKTSKCTEKGTGLRTLQFEGTRFYMYIMPKISLNVHLYGWRRTNPTLLLYSLYLKDNTYSKMNTQTTYI